MTRATDERGFGRSAGTLSVGIGAAGLLTYVFFALSSHNLDADAYGEIVVLWSLVFISISVLHRPIEQFLTRTVAERRTHGEAIAPALRSAAKLQAALALGFAALALALRGPLEDVLSGDSTLYWVYLSSVLLFAAGYFARGYLAGVGRFGLYAGMLICESGARTVFALALALGIAGGQDLVALGIVAAPLVSLLIVPLAFGRRAVAAARTGLAAGTDPGVAEAVGLAESGAFAGAVFWIMLSEQAFLNGGPLLLRGLEGAAAAGFIFNVLMLARAPLLVFQGVSVSLLPHLTRLRSHDTGDSHAEFDLSIGQTLRAVAGFTVIVAVIVALLGPTLMQLAFGERFSYDRAGLLIVTAAMGLYLASTTLNQAVLAQGLARNAAIAWSACAAGFIAWCALPLIEAADLRIEIGFALAAAALCAALWRIYRAAVVRPAPG